jgi:hypothetical protein
MRRIVLTARWYLAILAGIYIILLTAVFGFSLGVSNLAIALLLILSLVMSGFSSVTIPFLDVDILPIVPNKKFWVTISIICFCISGAFWFFGEDLINSAVESKKTTFENWSNRLDQSNRNAKIYIIPKNHPCYKKTGPWFWSELKRVGPTGCSFRVLYLEKKTFDGFPEKMALVVIPDTDNKYINGKQYWVPLAGLVPVEESESKLKPSSSSSVKDDSGSEEGVIEDLAVIWYKVKSRFKDATPYPLKEVTLTPAELRLAKVESGISEIRLPEFTTNCLVSLEKDLVIRTGSPETIVKLYFGNHRFRQHSWKGKGSVIRVPKKTVSKFAGDGQPVLFIVSEGSDHQVVSNLNLKRFINY